MSHHLKEEFWDRIEDARVGMLSTGFGRTVPMSHYADDDEDGNVMWFITAKDTDVAKAAAANKDVQYTVTSDKEGLYAAIDGKLSLSTDTKKLDDIWNVFAAAWFKDGKDDPNVQLVRLDLTKAEVWATEGKLAFLYEVAKANLTDDIADAGHHGTIVFRKAA